MILVSPTCMYYYHNPSTYLGVVPFISHKACMLPYVFCATIKGVHCLWVILGRVRLTPLLAYLEVVY